MSTQSAERPILIHDRIDANRRRTRWLQGVLGLACLPACLYVMTYFMSSFVMASVMMVPSSAAAGEIPIVRMTIAALVTVAFVVAVTAFLYTRSAALVLRLTGARVLERGGTEEEEELARIVENLCIGSGLPRPRLAVIESTGANAYSTGVDPEGSTLVVTRGLLNLMDRQELEGVVAQELSQIGNEDVRLGTVTATTVAVLWLPYLLLGMLFRAMSRLNPRLGTGCMLAFIFVFVVPTVFSVVVGLGLGMEMIRGSGPIADEYENPMMAGIALISVILLAAYGFAGAPVIGLFIRRAISREREFLADADAALLTRYPPGLARALTKMRAVGVAVVNTQPSIAHLWIVDPGGGGRGSWSRFWSVHPPLDDRIETLSRMGGTTPSMLEEAEADAVRYRRSVLGVSDPSETALR